MSSQSIAAKALGLSSQQQGHEYIPINAVSMDKRLSDNKPRSTADVEADKKYLKSVNDEYTARFRVAVRPAYAVLGGLRAAAAIAFLITAAVLKSYYYVALTTDFPTQGFIAKDYDILFAVLICHIVIGAIYMVGLITGLWETIERAIMYKKVNGFRHLVSVATETLAIWTIGQVVGVNNVMLLVFGCVVPILLRIAFHYSFEIDSSDFFIRVDGVAVWFNWFMALFATVGGWLTIFIYGSFYAEYLRGVDPTVDLTYYRYWVVVTFLVVGSVIDVGKLLLAGLRYLGSQTEKKVVGMDDSGNYIVVEARTNALSAWLHHEHNYEITDAVLIALRDLTFICILFTKAYLGW